MIPIGDDLVTRRFAWVNYLIIGVTILVWLVVQGAGANETRLAASICNLGLVPGELTGRAPLGMAVPIAPGLACVVDHYTINWFTPLISIFLHGSWMHLLGNMLFLWVFGDNIEDALGHGRYLLFYIVCGLAAAVAHIMASPGSPIPTVGASGAISGVMGAYLILYPNAPVRMFFLIFVARIRAWIVLLYWFAVQVFQGLSQLGPVRSEVSGIAFWAHVGGFLTGVLLVKVFENEHLVARSYVRR